MFKLLFIFKLQSQSHKYHRILLLILTAKVRHLYVLDYYAILINFLHNSLFYKKTPYSKYIFVSYRLVQGNNLYEFVCTFPHWKQ